MYRLVGVITDNWGYRWYQFRSDCGAERTVWDQWFWSGWRVRSIVDY